MTRRRIGQIALAVALCLLCALAVVPRPSQAYAAESVKDTNIVYESVEKEIVVSRQKVCSITETITVEYRNPGINLGLRRNVSRWNKITRIVDGKKYVRKTRSALTLQSVLMDGQPEYNFLEVTDNYYYINTGADGDYKAGRHVYEFTYEYDLGEDFIGKFDDFTFDIMDYGFRGAVGRFAATITMPDPIDIDALSFRTNGMAPLSHDDVALAVEGNTLRCRYEALDAEHGLTVQLILPDGYFDTQYRPDGFYITVLCLTAVAVVALLLLWRLCRRPPGVVLTAEYYPPDGYSPLDVARVYRGRIRPKDFAALILYWVSLGLIDLRPKGKKDFILTRKEKFPTIPATDDEREATKRKERNYYNALFGGLRRVNRPTEFHTDIAKRRQLPASLKKAVNALYGVKNGSVGALVGVRIAGHALATLPMLLLIFWKGSIGGSFVTVMIMLFPLIALMVAMYVPMPIVFKVVWCSLFGGPTFAIVISQIHCAYDICAWVIVAAIVFALGNILARFIIIVPRDDKQLIGRILGFKRFLVTAELDKLEALVAETPEYFFDILPYCYVFGITKKMERKFSTLGIPPQQFPVESYSGLCRGLSHSMHSSTSAFHSGGGGGGSGGGGGGGGGSSGGGGGGGGCGGR